MGFRLEVSTNTGWRRVADFQLYLTPSRYRREIAEQLPHLRLRIIKDYSDAFGTVRRGHAIVRSIKAMTSAAGLGLLGAVFFLSVLH